MQDPVTTREIGRAAPVWARRAVVAVVAVVGGYFAVISAAFASWSDIPAGWGRAADGAPALVVSALVGLATAAAALFLAGRGVTLAWVAAGLAPAAWGVLNAVGRC